MTWLLIAIIIILIVIIFYIVKENEEQKTYLHLWINKYKICLGRADSQDVEYFKTLLNSDNKWQEKHSNVSVGNYLNEQSKEIDEILVKYEKWAENEKVSKYSVPPNKLREELQEVLGLDFPPA